MSSGHESGRAAPACWIFKQLPFGANILDAAIILLADVFYPGPAVLNEVGLSTAAAGLLGMVLTAVWLVGLVRRRGRVILGLGLDSGVVLALYLAGVALLYSLR